MDAILVIMDCIKIVCRVALTIHAARGLIKGMKEKDAEYTYHFGLLAMLLIII